MSNANRIATLACAVVLFTAATALRAEAAAGDIAVVIKDTPLSEPIKIGKGEKAYGTAYVIGGSGGLTLTPELITALGKTTELFVYLDAVSVSDDPLQVEFYLIPAWTKGGEILVSWPNYLGSIAHATMHDNMTEASPPSLNSYALDIDDFYIKHPVTGMEAEGKPRTFLSQIATGAKKFSVLMIVRHALNDRLTFEKLRVSSDPPPE